MTTVLLAGATGLIGREFMRQWQGPGTLHLLVRKPVGELPPGTQVHVVQFRKLPPLPAADEAYCCLGTTLAAAGSREGFRSVDMDAVLLFARAAFAAGVRRFAAVSSLGADARSANFYSRVKGEMEDALATIGFTSLVLVRPSLLIGDRASLGQEPRFAESVAVALSRPLAPLIPATWRPITAARVARGMQRALADARSGVRIVESRELQRLGR
jgi:uncharacterized protein YbjT (DUF2867 family)